MRVTIEIEPEEAARFFKEFVPEQVRTFVDGPAYGPGLIPEPWANMSAKWLAEFRGESENKERE